MKQIAAYIQPFMLQKVLRELRAIHVRGMTVLEAQGFGREKDESYPHHSADYAVDFTPKVKLELLCHDEEVEALLAALRRGAHTGRRGDGKILVSPIERLMSIRTDGEGEGAL